MISVAMMPNGMSRCGLLAFFGGGGDRIEADVGEEDDRRAGQHAGEAVRRERMPVRRFDRAGRAEAEDQDRDDLDHHHRGVGAGAFAHAAHQNPRHQHGDHAAPGC